MAELKIKWIMGHNPLTISENATIREAAQLMLDHKISGLPVIDNKGKLVGIITEFDIFRLVVRAWDRIIVCYGPLISGLIYFSVGPIV